MPVIWKDKEIELLELLRPVMSTREIQTIFKRLGHSRTMEAISKKARKLDVSFKDFGAPAVIGLSTEEKEIINEVLEEREQ